MLFIFSFIIQLHLKIKKTVELTEIRGFYYILVDRLLDGKNNYHVQRENIENREVA